MERHVLRDGVITETWTFEGDNVSVERSLDIEPVLESVAEIASNTGGKSALGYHVGRIDHITAANYAKARGIALRDLIYHPGYSAELLALCKSRDFRKLSPTEGKA